MLVLKNINFSYPSSDILALKDVSLEVKAGTLTLCLGKSGCGKSTLLSVLNGLAYHYVKGNLSGEAIVNKKLITDCLPGDLAKDVGSLFQDPERQFFALTVEEEIGFALQWKGLLQDEVEEAVKVAAERLGILDILGNSIFSLSEGQKQKVALASLLATEPKALLLDEPSANLDPESTKELAKILKKLKDQGLAILVVDHRLSWLKDVADEVVVLSEGKLIRKGTYNILDDSNFRKTYGLRDINIKDVRETLQDKELYTEDATFCCKNLTFSYPKSKALFENLSLSFKKGEVVGIIGANGCGKTTLAKIFTGLEKTKSGDIFVNNSLIKQKKLTNYVQVVLQNASHQLRMQSVWEELDDAAAFIKNSEERNKKIKLILDDYGLAHLSKRHPQSLSGGEQQRLAVAVAAVREPTILILDEPSSGLDGDSMLKMAASIKNIANSGTSVLLISHDLELLREVCTCKIKLPLI